MKIKLSQPVCLALIFLLSALAFAQKSEYRLKSGDTLEIQVAGLPDHGGMFTIDEQFDAAVHQATALQAVTFA